MINRQSLSLAWPFGVIGLFFVFAIAHRMPTRADSNPLIQAINRHDPKLVADLLDKGTDPNRRYTIEDHSRDPVRESITPVQVACLRFIDSRPAIDGQDPVQEDCIVIIRDLVHHGARLNQISTGRFRENIHAFRDVGSELTYAVSGRSPTLYKLLVELGADPKLPCRAGPTLFFCMHEESDIQDAPNLREIYQQLKASGVDIDKRDSLGRTALHYAAILRLSERCQYLVELGANVNVKDKIGMSALDCAKSKETYDLLVAAGAKHGDKF